MELKHLKCRIVQANTKWHYIYVRITFKESAAKEWDHTEKPRVSENDIVSVFSASSCYFMSLVNTFLWLSINNNNFQAVTLFGYVCPLLFSIETMGDACNIKSSYMWKQNIGLGNAQWKHKKCTSFLFTFCLLFSILLLLLLLHPQVCTDRLYPKYK